MPILNHQLSNSHQRHQGLTLIELIIGIFIIGAISTIIFRVYLSNFKLFTTQSLAISVADQNKIALDEMSNTARQAVWASFSCFRILCQPGGFGVTNYFQDISPNHLALSLWPLDPSGNPIDPSSQTSGTCQPDYVSYYLGDDATKSDSPTKDPDNYFHLTRETVQNNSPNCPSSRPHGKKIIATKIKDVNGITFALIPSSNNATEVKITVNTQGTAFFLKIPYTISKTTSARFKNRPPTGYVTIPFPYAVQADSAGIAFTGYGGNDANIITGDTYSNGIIGGNNGSPQPRINGNAWAHTYIDHVTVTGSSTSPAATISLPAFDQNYWITAAERVPANINNCDFGSGPHLTNTVTISSNQSLGPAEIQCNLSVTADATLTLTGPVHVKGAFSMQNAQSTGTTLQFDSSKCPVGTVLIADQISIGTGAHVLTSGSSPKSYILLAGYRHPINDPFNGTRISVYATDINAILYAIKTDSGGYFNVFIGDSSQVKTGAVVGNTVTFGLSAKVTGDPDLSSANFSTCQ